MSDEITELAPGVHSAAFAREDAWHKLGTTVTESMTADQALQTAHLAGWNVRKLPLTASEITPDGVTTLQIPDRFATVFTNPITGATEYLDVVGSVYETFQNEMSVELLDNLVDLSGAHFETAGSIRGGKETFVSMKMPNHLLIDGRDAVDLYIVALNSHDGSTRFRILVTPVRVVCKNTIQAALQNHRSMYAVKHTRGANVALTEAREALKLTFAYQDEFQQEAEQMIASSYSESSLVQLTGKLFGGAAAVTDRQKKVIEQHIGSVVDLWRTSPTMEEIRGTKWGAYAAVTEYLDHFMPFRGGNDENRALRTVLNANVQQIKLGAFAALS